MRRIFSLQNILLILLIVTFYNEILVLGLRVYVAFTDNPRAELLLADYYQSASYYNNNYANRFYQVGFDKLKTNITKEQGDEKYKDAMQLAKLYQCGLGSPRDLAQAKTWYQEALKAASNDTQKKAAQQQLAILENPDSSSSTSSSSNSANPNSSSSNSASLDKSTPSVSAPNAPITTATNTSTTTTTTAPTATAATTTTTGTTATTAPPAATPAVSSTCQLQGPHFAVHLWNQWKNLKSQ